MVEGSESTYGPHGQTTVLGSISADTEAYFQYTIATPQQIAACVVCT